MNKDVGIEPGALFIVVNSKNDPHYAGFVASNIRELMDRKGQEWEGTSVAVGDILMFLESYYSYKSYGFYYSFLHEKGVVWINGQTFLQDLDPLEKKGSL
jgi:hypothetical protein